VLSCHRVDNVEEAGGGVGRTWRGEAFSWHERWVTPLSRGMLVCLGQVAFAPVMDDDDVAVREGVDVDWRAWRVSTHQRRDDGAAHHRV